MNVNVVLNCVYQLVEEGQSRTAGKHLMEAMEAQVATGNFDAVRDIFNVVDVTRLSAHSLIGLVRSSARYKEQIPNWQQTYEAAWIETRKQGHDPKSFFVGMQELSWL